MNNNIRITERHPTGYISKELVFCKHQEEELHNSELEHPHPELTMLRNALLKKRAEFKKLWDKGRIK